VYAREIEGRELTFGVSGKLIMNALVMYDRQTDSLWSQFLGVGVAGHFEGTALEPLGSSLTTWGEWRDAHPATLVLDQGGRRRDAYSSYYTDGSAGVLGESIADDRLQRKEFVAGVQWEGGAKAYPFRHLNETPTVNDRFRGRDILVVFSSESATVAVYDRRLRDRTLSFEAATGAGTEGVAVPLRDAETGSLWSGRTGDAVGGPLAGERLELLPSLQVFWFAWSDFYPQTEFYEVAQAESPRATP
jgi:hypothetical protein